MESWEHTCDFVLNREDPGGRAGVVELCGVARLRHVPVSREQDCEGSLAGFRKHLQSHSSCSFSLPVTGKLGKCSCLRPAAARSCQVCVGTRAFASIPMNLLWGVGPV